MLAKAEIYALVALGLILAAIAAGAYERHVGYQEARNEDATAILAQQKQFDAEKAAADQRLKDAQDTYQAELERLSQPQPATHVVCHAASPSAVPASPGLQASTTAGSGPLPRGGSQDFDPGPALDALHDEADRIVAACRELDNSLPH